MDYDPVIGLEVHVQLKTASKLFCGCPTRFGSEPNSQTCPICLGLPGVLPVLNAQAFDWGILVGLALNCEIAPVMKFDRKQYYYPDLPKNFQISQYDRPLAQRGLLEVVVEQSPKRIRIRRVHLEEDTGKLVHEDSVTDTFVDFNRAGIPLLEVVSEPDLRSADDAHAYLVELKSILQYLGVSDCNMEEGSLRCDTNVSVRPRGREELGVKVEIKNLNSFRAVRQALEFEASRQSSCLERGDAIAQETRLWDAKAGRTQPMRSKEEAEDYRYFPEPDLVPFVIDRAKVDQAKAKLPELPAQRRKRFRDTYHLSAYDAQVLTGYRALADLFEATVQRFPEPKQVANWMMGDLAAYLNARHLDPADAKVRPEWLANLLQFIAKGTITGTMAKDVLVQMLERGIDPAQLVRDQGLQQLSDPAALAELAVQVIRDNPSSVESYRKGKAGALMYLVGQAMKASNGKANPQQVTELLRQHLDGGGAGSRSAAGAGAPQGPGGQGRS